MKVLLVNPPLQDRTIARDMAGGLGFQVGKFTILPPLNLALLASILRASRHQVTILDPQVESFTEEALLAGIQACNPEVVVGNVSLPSLRNDGTFLRKVRNITAAKIIARTDINFLPLLEQALDLTGADLLMTGECELEADQILQGNPVPGAAWQAQGKIHFSPSPPIADLDMLPLAARDLLRNERYFFPPLGAGVTTMQTSRGCPFSCSYYCPYPLVQGKKWRAMSAVRVFTELKDIVDNHNISRVFFRDACFTLDQERVSQICELILTNKLTLKWWCETRINCLNEELLLVMKQAGCQGINVGVETGDPEVLSSQAKEGVSTDDIQNLCELAGSLEMSLHFLLLVGLPQEDRNSLYQTFRLIRKLKPTSLGVSVVTPYPGTPLYHEAEKRGWIETGDWEEYTGDRAVMHTDKLSSRDLRLTQKVLLGCSFLSRTSGLSASFSLEMLDRFFKTWSRRGKPNEAKNHISHR